MVDDFPEWDAESIRRRIAELPAGSISMKTIKGKEQPYLQWTQDGKTKSRYLKASEREAVIAQVEERKRLEAELAKKGDVGGSSALTVAAPAEFNTNCLIGSALERFASFVEGWKRRACFVALEKYLQSSNDGKVLILYGLRRTGKSTMLRQAILRMTADQRAQSAYITVTPGDSLAMLNRDLRALYDAGFTCVFVDEVTMLDDFIESASLFSDIYAALGMKVVLSGTDSLGFLFSEDEQLYDRCAFIHTTFISYGEFERVLGIRGVDAYIEYGGTMSMSGVNYNTASPFATAQSADEYVDSAIAKNIQHSLRCYQHGGHFRRLQELYDKDELTSVINRVVEDVNHQFTLRVIERDFVSNDLAISAANLRKDPNSPSDVLDRIDVAEVTEKLRRLLDILNAPERTVPIDGAAVSEIKEYLDLLDLTVEIPLVDASDYNARQTRTAISQPGLRFAQAKALVNSLLEDNEFRAISLSERKAVAERILSEVRGRMLEDAILLETSIANPLAEVFKMQFPVGEFDMVVFWPDRGTCSLYEVKHSSEEHANQRRHLLNEEMLRMAELRFGTVEDRVVLYRGEARTIDGISYVNVEEYLRSL
ncbi:MAG: AAA family ATPase [Eggerthellaceae bacterium]|nr:AAA family ATPase [Eggerthellaceae bacterium]